MKSSGRKLSLTSYDDIFSSEESRVDAQRERITEIPLSQLHPFKNHPFKVLDDERMQDTAQSIREYGVLVPAIVRPREEGGYEIVAGHRRKRGCEIAGLDTMPVIIRELDDDAATLVMVDSNIQRETLLPSERAFAYKMKLDAIARVKGRPKKVGQVVPDYSGKRSTEIVAEGTGESYKQVQRFIRLTYLIPELLDMVDNKKIAFNPAVELSYLRQEEQTQLLDEESASPDLDESESEEPDEFEEDAATEAEQQEEPDTEPVTEPDATPDPADEPEVAPQPSEETEIPPDEVQDEIPDEEADDEPLIEPDDLLPQEPTDDLTEEPVEVPDEELADEIVDQEALPETVPTEELPVNEEADVQLTIADRIAAYGHVYATMLDVAMVYADSTMLDEQHIFTISQAGALLLATAYVPETDAVKVWFMASDSEILTGYVRAETLDETPVTDEQADEMANILWFDYADSEAGTLLVFVVAGEKPTAQEETPAEEPAMDDSLFADTTEEAEVPETEAYELDHYGELHPEYQEVTVEADEIWHDPYALISIISAYHNGEPWTIDDVYHTLETFFHLQYVVTESVESETRYTTEIVTEWQDRCSDCCSY